MIDKTRHWIERVVVGLNLCPFAAPVLRDNSLLISVCEDSEPELILRRVLQELDALQRSNEKEVATSVLVLPYGLSSFDDYLDLADEASALLEQVGLEGVIQIATFHPDYCFEGVEVEDISNYSNRSPYPMLHFIREGLLSRALANYPNPDQIPENNIKRLQALGFPALKALLNGKQ